MDTGTPEQNELWKLKKKKKNNPPQQVRTASPSAYGPSPGKRAGKKGHTGSDRDFEKKIKKKNRR